MYVNTKIRKKIKLYVVSSLTLLFILCIIINSNLFITNQPTSFTENDESNILEASTSEVSGKPLLIHQYSTITSSFFPSSLPTNVSFTLFEDWTSQNININYEGVAKKLQRVTNGNFDVDAIGWLYKSNVPAYYINYAPAGQYVEIRMAAGSRVLGDYGYFEQNFTIPEELCSRQVSSLSVDYYYTNAQYTNIAIYLAVIINGVEVNMTQGFQYLVYGNWATLTMNYNPSDYGQIGLGNATVRVGISTIGPVTIAQFSTMRFDNIKLNLWTMPNEPNLIRVFDNDFASNYSYVNTSYGKGYTFIDVERYSELTNDVILSIYSNITDVLDFCIYNITIYSPVDRTFNTTFSSVEGSKYSFGDGMIWETYMTFSENYKYGEIWAEIIKPTDWNIIHLYDRDNIDRVGSCLAVGLGSNKATIPIGIMTPSNIERSWKIEASSENYIVAANLAYWNDTEYLEGSKITFGDIFQINVTLNNTIPLLGTTLNCTIYYPNGTLFWYQSKVISTSNVQFGNLMVGFNMTVGSYQVTLEWANNQSYLYTDKAGFKTFDFSVWHHTNLTAIDSYIEILAGDPLLIKAKFTDFDFNSIIAFADVNYSSTFGQSGTMIYIGSGIYFAEIDSNSLEIGDYYFSITANKLYYENLTITNIIHLKIVPQPLALELSSRVLQADANSIASCQASVIGAISKTLLYPANLSTNWFNPYNVTLQPNGTYVIDFSTMNIPTEGYLDSYNIEIYANKTNYGQVTEVLSLLVYPIPTIANTNASLFTVYQDDIIKIKANYTVEGSSELIGGANCTVDWQGTYQINPLSNEFEITLNTTGLAVDYYSILITFRKAGYEIAFKNIVVVINEKEVSMSAIINSIEINENELIEVYFQQQVNISVRVSTVINPIYLSGGTITFISPQYQQPLMESPLTYFNISIMMDGAYFATGINTIFLRFEQTNYTTTIFAFQLYIRAQNINLTVQVNYQDISENTLLEYYYNQLFVLSCRAYAEIEAIYLSGGTVTLVNNEKEMIIPEVADYWFNYSIIISTDFFSSGFNYVYLRFEQANYTTTTFPFQFYIRAQNIDLTVYVNSQYISVDPLIESYYNQFFNISCRAYAEIESTYLSGGTITFVNNEQEVVISEVADYWFNASIVISSSMFSLGVNNVYIRFEQTNYTTTAITFQILVKQIEIQVNPINFLDTIGDLEGENIVIQLQLIEELSSNIIVNATLFYSWRFGTGDFYYISNGTYESEQITLPTGYWGNYPLRVVITTNNTIYKSREYSIIVSIGQKPVPNYLMWIITGSLAIGIGVLGTLSLRSYVLLPRKRKKEAELLDKVQVYKDVANMQALMIIQKTSGIPIYSQEIRIFGEEDDSFLVSGFIQAITNFSEVLIRREFDKPEEVKGHAEYAKYIIELDFKIFQLLVCDYGVVRILIFLKDTSSEHLKKQLYYLALALNTQYSEEFANFTGDIKLIKDDLIFMINQFLSLHYIEPFEVNRDQKYVNAVLDSKELTKLETRLFNVITSITSKNNEFNLQIPIEQIHEKDENLVLEALDTLIKKKLIVSTYSEKLKGKNRI